MINSLQSLRFVFALMIFFHHSAMPIGALGSFPVSFFLVLSGFMLMMGYGDKIEQMGYVVFFKKRILRIYPTHLLCLVFALLLKLMISTPIEWCKVIPAFLMLQAWIPNADFYFAGNSVAWYMSVIVFCYLIFPLAAKYLKKAPRLFIILGIVLYFVLSGLVPDGYYYALIYISPLCRVFDFILGMSLSVFVSSKYYSLLSSMIKNYSFLQKTMVELTLVVLSLFLVSFSESISPKLGFAVLWWLPSLSIITVFYMFNHTGGGIFDRLLSNGILVFLGSISFAFYLLHISILGVNGYLMGFYNINYCLDGVIVLSVTILLAYFITYYFEPLFTKKKNNQ